MTLKVGDLVQRIPEERTGNWERWVAKHRLSTDVLLVVSHVYEGFGEPCLKFEGLNYPFAGWHSKNFQLVKKDYTIEEFL